MVSVKNTLLLAMAASVQASPLASSSTTSTSTAAVPTVTYIPPETDLFTPPAFPEGAIDISNNRTLVNEIKKEYGLETADEKITTPGEVTIMSGSCNQGSCPDYDKAFDMMYTWSQQSTPSPGGAPPNVLVWNDFNIRVNDCGKCYIKRVGSTGGGCYDFTACGRAQSICVDSGKNRAHRIWKDNGHKTCYRVEQVGLGGCGIIMMRVIYRPVGEIACNCFAAPAQNRAINVCRQTKYANIVTMIANENQLPDTSADERERLLETVSFDQWLDANTAGNPRPEASRATPTKSVQPFGLQAGPQGLLIYHGPTSIYRIRTGGPPLSPGDMASSNGQFDHVAQHFGIDLEDQVIMTALHQFFRWQYPHFMFIYREAFLRDHFGQRTKSKYWSLPLLMAICALGAVMLPDRAQSQMSEQFYAAAESIIIVSGLTHPSITAVQVFLCLAFYQIGKGELSKGWELSGIAFRMAQDLGFQKDPEQWIASDASLATSEDVEIRRRIYWGCYTSDKIISLILGRPVQLYDEAGEVEHTESLPDFPDMAPWLPAGVDISRMLEPGSLGGRERLITSFSEHILLSKTIERILCTLFSRKSVASGETGLTLTDDLDLELCRWQESLPDCIKWNRWETPTTSLLPSVAALYILFNSTRIVLHLDRVSADASSQSQSVSRTVCTSAAQDVVCLVRQYRAQHGLEHAPLIFIYGIVQAHRAMRALDMTPHEATYLVQSLDECCVAWGLAVQARAHLYELF
ncbi:hypothetical protein CDV31_005122 [Fusarium ambrosium]|uniref:Xylanolytic transcriptional activator regulatory domain-containing protein n=1 Tax=Fusarium ambrosium TaxID=131363 RepID=A0A428ULM5_9HYPO|nr:hypothetical protein CDV31_005122 [Fusarium ambrosium]